MNLSRILIASSLAILSLGASAVPAKRGLFPFTQPDGSVIMIQRVGDEWSHFTLTEDRQILSFNNNDGGYYYGRMTEDGNIVPSAVLATSPANRTEADLAVMTDFDKVDISAINERRNSRRRAATAASQPASRAAEQSGMGRFSGNFPRTGKVRGLVILVQYKDVKFTHPDPVQYFGDLLMKEGFNEYGGTGSAHDYFIANSGGKFDPQFDLYGPVTLSNNRKYYGENDDYGDDKRPAQMIADACRLLDSKINFADYDMDNDGYVDNVFVFYAGMGEASGGPAESVWPHQWELSSAGLSQTLDGKKINKYACSNEWEGSRPDGVGTFVHEFSHVMGLPDLYCTAEGVYSVTPDSWSVLDYGPYNNDGRTPPNYSMFERNAMGWVDPIVLDEGANIDLENLADSNVGCLVPTGKSTEFFLIENRQQTGWDTYLPGHGMLIWHVDFVQRVWDSNAVNNTPSHTYVRIIQANNNSSAYSGWSWPGTSHKTSFTSRTSPAFKTWAGTAVDMPITDIEEVGGHIYFTAGDGAPVINTPVASNPTNISDGGFTATWQPVDGATDYLLTVNAIKEGGSATQTYDGKTLPSGWSKTFSEEYATAGNYGNASPSLKFSSSNARLLTTTFSGDITSLSFWNKGMGIDSSSFLTIEGYKDGNWISIDKYYPTNNKALTYTNNNIPAGVRQIRLSYNKSKGNLAIDDIAVTYGSNQAVTLAGYNNLSTGGQTSRYVDITGSGATKFEYTVKATDGKNMSRVSNVVAVDLADANGAGIDDVTADANAPVEYYNLQGIKVENPANGLYIRKQGNQVTKVLIKSL